MTTNDDLMRAIAMLEASLGYIGEAQSRLAHEVHEMAKLVEHHTKALETLTNESSALEQARTVFEQGFEDFRIESAARACEFERTQKMFAHALELVEGRVRQMRDELADAAE
jgi:hypothetical protein